MGGRRGLRRGKQPSRGDSGVPQPLACASGFHESAMPVLGAPVSFMYDPVEPGAALICFTELDSRRPLSDCDR